MTWALTGIRGLLETATVEKIMFYDAFRLDSIPYPKIIIGPYDNPGDNDPIDQRNQQ
jgi:hypothetical protein